MGGTSYLMTEELACFSLMKNELKHFFALSRSLKGRWVPSPSLGTPRKSSVSGKEKEGKDNYFHCIFLYPCSDKPVTNPFLVQLSAGYPITWGLNYSYHIKNTKENLSAGLNHPRGSGVSSPCCFEVDWQSCELTAEGGVPTKIHALPLIPYSLFFEGR